MPDLHQYVECDDDVNCECGPEHCGVCGWTSGPDGRAAGCRWDLAAEDLAKAVAR